MTSKQRAYLKGLAMTMDPIFQFGKNSLTPENDFMDPIIVDDCEILGKVIGLIRLGIN